MLGSANLTGSRLFHMLSGNLSHQIEHHLFPDIPAHRYAEIAVEVREICERYGLPYNTGPLHKQFGSVVKKIVRLALPGRGRPPGPTPPRRSRRRRAEPRAGDGRLTARRNGLAFPAGPPRRLTGTRTARTRGETCAKA